MPPAKRRPRTYDPARTRAAVLAQFGHVHEGVRALTDEQLGRSAQLGGWTVREVAVHLTMALGSVADALAEPEPAAQELALTAWPAGMATRSARIDEDTRALTARTTGQDQQDGQHGQDAEDAEDAEDGGRGLDGLYRRTAARLAEALAGAPDRRLIVTRGGAMTLADYLVTRTVELVVHTDDLNRATGLDIPLDRQALAACTRLLADALAAGAPGASTEVRIPPFAVVQCVEGPRHTRGTPPNVVETDPLTWVRLATGRTRWDMELEAARVSASGERADLSGLLPVMR